MKLCCVMRSGNNLCYDNRYIVELLAFAKIRDLVDDCLREATRGEMLVFEHCFDKTGFTKFFAGVAVGFDDPIRVQHQDVSAFQGGL